MPGTQEAVQGFVFWVAFGLDMFTSIAWICFTCPDNSLPDQRGPFLEAPSGLICCDGHPATKYALSIVPQVDRFLRGTWRRGLDRSGRIGHPLGRGAGGTPLQR